MVSMTSFDEDVLESGDKASGIWGCARAAP